MSEDYTSSRDLSPVVSDATTRHSAGPWTAECERAEYNGPWTVWAGDRELATVEWWDNAEANARLIAAAPELLSALEYFLKAQETGRSEPLFIARDAARNAIDKALGRLVASRAEDEP